VLTLPLRVSPWCRLYFGESNVEAMLATLLPLHEMMDKQGPSTLKEIAFVQVGVGGGCLGGARGGVHKCCAVQHMPVAC